MTKEFKFVFNALFSNENITPLTNEDNLFYFKFLLGISKNTLTKIFDLVKEELPYNKTDKDIK